MELQLGLALPTHTIRGLDLNTYTFEPSKDADGSSQLMINQASLQLCGPWPRACSDDDDNDDDDFSSNQQQKRSFSDAFEEITDVPRTLPLLLWNKQPNDDDDDDDDDDDLKDHQKSSHFAFNNVDGDSEGIVGWPPIKFRRKKISHRSKRNGAQNNQSVDNGCPDCHGKPSNSMYVKVKVEGDAIGRKIDLSLYDSFQDLKQTLLGMFGISQENATSYKLTFQDRDGDWLLADDVSWRSFIWSVQRLKLMRSRCGSEQD